MVQAAPSFSTPGAFFAARSGGKVEHSNFLGLELAAAGDDKGDGGAYISAMRILLYLGLFGLLGLAFWFAGSAFMHFRGEPIPFYGYVAIAGGVVMSLLVGGGLMALVFYSNRRGYDDDVR